MKILGTVVIAMSLFASCKEPMSNSSLKADDDPVNPDGIYLAILSSDTDDDGKSKFTFMVSTPKTDKDGSLCAVKIDDTDEDVCQKLEPHSEKGEIAFYKAPEAVVLSEKQNLRVEFKKENDEKRTLLVEISKVVQATATPDETPDDNPADDTPNDVAESIGLPTFKTLKFQRDDPYNILGSVLEDIADHLPNSLGNQYHDNDRVTYGHETTHGINSHIRNTMNTSGEKTNGFYILGGKVVLVKEPKIAKSAAAAYIPTELRNIDITKRFNMYVTGQAAWDDRPLYILDEWVAYTNGSEVAKDIFVNHGDQDLSDREAFGGTLEFTFYAIGVARAAQAKDPGYFDREPEFKKFLAFNIKRSLDLVHWAVGAGKANENIKGYLEKVKSADPEFLAFCNEFFGESFTNDVILR